MAIQPATSEPLRCQKATLSAPRALGVLLLVAISHWAPSAAAETPNSVPDPVAQALFQDGRDLVDRGEWAAGCTKFEASMLLYPAASTAVNIARCYEHDQKLASAWSAYKRAQVLNRETLGEERKRAIDEVITAELNRLTPRLPKLKLSLTKQVPGVTLRKDGEELPQATIGTELPVDVGEYEITAEAPGHKPFRARVSVKEGESREIAINLLGEDESDPTESIYQSPPKWAWFTGGASLLFMGVAAGFRIDQAFVEGYQSGICNGNVQSGCPALSVYDPESDNSRKNLDFGMFVGFGAAGVAALAASIYGFVRGQSAPPPPVAGLFVTKQGALATAKFQF